MLIIWLCFCPSKINVYICLSNKTETSSAGEQLVRDNLTSDAKKVESKELSELQVALSTFLRAAMP